ncbi:isoprenoid synthase domain-containing protein [Suillus subalutaceus]|uniref:isoprenoid synthase domain-containing protein n=1 Tax=Suillus subalutaceus TaxID=48586 RepID=UPI001B885200|nr:isoprenoid synthase domain-containing protein [Suillus subalutaceus]KAG1837270.1 isoprenoid synthase domain-containing protein [Suillus subalutaceus]
MNPTIVFPTVTHTTTLDCEPSQFILPDLINDCHYYFRQNLHGYAVSRASDQWLIDVARLVEHELRGYIEMDAGRYAAVCYPDADAFHLQVCSDFFAWGFILDDLMEYGVVDVRGALESCISALRDPINFDTEQLGARMCKSFGSRFRETAGPGCTKRFIHRIELYFAAVAKQVDDRAKGNMYDLQSFIALRRDLCGLKPSFTLIEFVARIDLPDEVMSHPAIVALEYAANDHVCWANDIVSYNKEQSQGDAHWQNLVAVLMHDRGLDIQGAMNHTGQMCKDAIQRFESNRAILPSWGEEVDKQVAIYVEGLQNWMIGSLHWHFNSPRYFGKDGHAVKRDRIVKLLPQRPSV